MSDEKNYKEIIADSQKAPSKEVFEAKKGPSENVDWTNKKVLNSILTEAENGLIFGNDRKAALEKIVELALKALK